MTIISSKPDQVAKAIDEQVGRPYYIRWSRLL